MQSHQSHRHGWHWQKDFKALWNWPAEFFDVFWDETGILAVSPPHLLIFGLTGPWSLLELPSGNLT